MLLALVPKAQVVIEIDDYESMTTSRAIISDMSHVRQSYYVHCAFTLYLYRIRKHTLHIVLVHCTNIIKHTLYIVFVHCICTFY